MKDLAEPFALTQPAISKHLRVLERAGLVERGRQAQWRPRRLRTEPLGDVTAWIELIRRHRVEGYERLDALLSDLTQQQEHRHGDDDDRDPHRPR